MGFEIPTLQALAQRTANAFRSNLKGSDARLWPNNVAVSAKVIAGPVWEAFSFLTYISRIPFAHLCDGVWLERHGAELGLSRLPATFAEGDVTLTGDAGVVVPAGLILVRADDVEFVTTTGGQVSGLGSVTVKARCSSEGRAGNCFSGVTLTLATPFSRIVSATTVAAAGIGGGADVENDESYRARILFRKRNPPHGGAAHDYVSWAREINGVTRVFVDPVTSTNSRTTVGVWFLMDDTYVNGIPQAADVTMVASFIDTQRPAGALVEVGAPVAAPVNITITGLSPDTTVVREAIMAELRSMFRREVRVSTATQPFKLHRSLISEAISIATGEHHHTLSAPASDVTYSTGQLPTLGTVTFS